LADNICKVIEDKKFRKHLGTKARANIRRFSQDEVMKKWTILFEQLNKEESM